MDRFVTTLRDLPRTTTDRARSAMELCMRVSVAFACLIALGCERETSERPAARAPSGSGTPVSTAPFPDTAFSGNEPDAGSAPPEATDRFSTRHIGPRRDASGRRYE